MVSESEIMDWLTDNLRIENDVYYTEHDLGSKVFRIREELSDERNNSEMVLNGVKFELKDFLNIHL